VVVGAIPWLSSNDALLEGIVVVQQKTLRRKTPPLPVMLVPPFTTEKLIPKFESCSGDVETCADGVQVCRGNCPG
jgi:hypothetical protein